MILDFNPPPRKLIDEQYPVWSVIAIFLTILLLPFYLIYRAYEILFKDEEEYT